MSFTPKAFSMSSPNFQKVRWWLISDPVAESLGW
jgi:hypothetical protein